ncbi:hypothetical protein E4T47_02461 [Aureobasidium subglaciale]|nr:hypothetical protein E4T47_02461 [Aureobasidium subglaciale]
MLAVHSCISISSEQTRRGTELGTASRMETDSFGNRQAIIFPLVLPSRVLFTSLKSDDCSPFDSIYIHTRYGIS